MSTRRNRRRTHQRKARLEKIMDKMGRERHDTELGELVKLLRDKEALVSAGARAIPMPPKGRLSYPKHIGSGEYWG